MGYMAPFFPHSRAGPEELRIEISSKSAPATDGETRKREIILPTNPNMR